MYGRNAKWIVGDVEPLLACSIKHRRRRALQALNPQPDGAVGVGAVALDSRKTGDLVLVKRELGSVGELVLGQPRCNTFIQLDERFYVVKQARQPPYGQFVFYRYLGGHVEQDP